MPALGKIIEQTIQRASLIGHVIEDLTYERIGPARFRAELVGWQKAPEYKQDGFFVFSDLRKGNYVLRVTGQRLQPVVLDVTIEEPDDLPSPVFISSRGDNELIVIVRAIENGSANNGGKTLKFDPAVLTQRIRAGAMVVSAGASTKLAASLDVGLVSFARVENADGLGPGSIVRIIRENSIRLKYDPYYLFASPITQVVGKVVSRHPLAGARVRITKLNDTAVSPNNVGDAQIFTGVDVNGDTIVLGVAKDISTVTNEKGDYNLYFSNETLASLKITDQTLSSLESEGVPSDVRTRLESLKGLVFRGSPRLLPALKEAIGEEQLARYRLLILKHAENFIRNVTMEASLNGFQTGVEEVSVNTGQRKTADFHLVKA